MAHYGKFENVKNYIAIVGNKNDQEKAGYYGEKIVLKCQELGLNTCWVAMTYGKSKAEIKRGQKLLIIISLGYGKTQGVPHKSKSIAELGKADQGVEWFDRGMEAVSLAPTAVNQQKFLFELKNGKGRINSLFASSMTSISKSFTEIFRKYESRAYGVINYMLYFFAHFSKK